MSRSIGLSPADLYPIGYLVLHALAIAAACSGLPLFVAVLWASDVFAARKKQPPEHEDAEQPLRLAA